MGELQRIHHKLQITLKALQPQQKWSNISHADKKAIKELKEKNYICLPSDKGTEFCVIQQDTYMQVTRKYPACQPRQLGIKSTQLGRTSVDRTSSLLLSKEAFLPQTPTFPDSTTSLRPTKPAQILKYDPSYLTSTDQPNASHGYLPTPSNRCWRTSQHI